MSDFATDPNLTSFTGTYNPCFKTLSFTPEIITEQLSVDPEVMSLFKRNRISYEATRLFNHFLITLKHTVYSREITRKTVTFPRDWWQAIRERWWPQWTKKRWPVKYETRILCIEELLPSDLLVNEHYNTILQVTVLDYKGGRL